MQTCDAKNPPHPRRVPGGNAQPFGIGFVGWFQNVLTQTRSRTSRLQTAWRRCELESDSRWKFRIMNETTYPIRFGTQSPQQNTSWPDILALWRELNDLGFDSAWLFDHFLPIFPDPTGPTAARYRARGNARRYCSPSRLPGTRSSNARVVTAASFCRREPGDCGDYGMAKPVCTPMIGPAREPWTDQWSTGA